MTPTPTPIRFDPFAADAGDDPVAGVSGEAELLSGVRGIAALPAPDRIAPALEAARTWAPRLPVPGDGDTLALWQALAGVAAVDLTVARVLEPHLDAVAILAQAGHEPTDGTYGVWAAEGAGPRVRAHRDGAGWVLTGRKPWCSLAADVDHALVTAWTSEHGRTLFAVDTAHPGLRPDDEAPWAPHGLPAVRSAAVDLDAVPATPVGAEGWYLQRPGFAWGGIGVAACWFGAAVALARRLRDAAGSREPDQIALAHLGAVDVVLHGAGAVLATASAAVDSGAAAGDAGAALALRARAGVRRAAEEVLTRCAHGLGPAPLATEAEHAARVADLGLYLRQEHAERDEAALGRTLLERAVCSAWASA